MSNYKNGVQEKEYEAVLQELQETFKSFVIEATAGSKNQAAALRSRKLSMDIRQLFAEFRRASIANDRITKKAKKEARITTVSETTTPVDTAATI